MMLISIPEARLMARKNGNGSLATPTAQRMEIPPSVRETVLRRCRRRCCMCFGLRGDLSVKEGQLAHLDRDRTNPEADNLAFLCQECHTHYDTKSNRVLGYTPNEVRVYRDELQTKLGYDHTEICITITVAHIDYEDVMPVVDEAYSRLRKCTRQVSRTERPVEPK